MAKLHYYNTSPAKLPLALTKSDLVPRVEVLRQSPPLSPKLSRSTQARIKDQRRKSRYTYRRPI